MRWLLLAHLAATLTMFGVIWVVQLVHYPLFASVGEAGWPAYAAEHQARITWIVGPAMLVELATAVALVWVRPDALPPWSVVAGVVLVGVAWGATALFSVPLHAQLSGGLDPEAVRRLVGTNWIRTAAWTLRAGLALWWTGLLLRA